MRTTVTLDEDVERLVREAMHRSRRGFKETLNAALRAGLSRGTAGPKGVPFFVKARPMRMRPGLDPAGFNRLVDEFEVDAFLEQDRNLVTDAQIAAAALRQDAVVHTADADFTRFDSLRWFNPISGKGNPKPSRARGS